MVNLINTLLRLKDVGLSYPQNERFLDALLFFGLVGSMVITVGVYLTLMPKL
jgi:hypothetical protein